MAAITVTFARTDAQEPAVQAATVQVATPVPLTCSGISMGGRLFAYHAIILDLPVGHIYSFAGQSGRFGNWASICILEYSSMIVFDSMTGVEIQRNVNDPRATPILDQIARDITLNPMPTPVVFVTPPTGPPGPVERSLPVDRGGAIARPRRAEPVESRVLESQGIPRSKLHSRRRPIEARSVS